MSITVHKKTPGHRSGADYPFSRLPAYAARVAGPALLAAAVVQLPAHAALSDTFQPFVGVSYTHDDNLLRLPDSPNGTPSDTVRQLYAGVGVEWPFGRQRFSGSARVNKVSYDRFDQLNYDGKDVSGTLYWMLGNQLDGTVGAHYVQSLASFNDFHSNERNLRATRSEFAEANYSLNPHWRLHSRVSRDKFENDLTQQRFLDNTEDAGELGLDFLGYAGSTIGAQLRHVKGKYPFPRVLGQFVLDDGYTQNEAKLKVFWRITEASQLQFLGGRVRRSHEQFTLRDATANTGRATATWSPVATVRLTAAAWRDFSPYEGSSAVSYALDKGISAGASWSASSRIQVEASVKRLKRDYTGLLLATLPSDINDTTRTANLGLTYQARSNLQLGVSAFHEVRKGGAIFSSAYRANGASAYASVQF